MTNFIPDIIDEIREYAEREGVPSRMVCPNCQGGTHNEECMSLFSGGETDATVFAKCHRAMCPVDTLCISGHNRGDIPERAAKVTHPPGTSHEVWASYEEKVPPSALAEYMEFPFKPAVLDRFVRRHPWKREFAIRLLDSSGMTRGLVKRWLGGAAEERVEAGYPKVLNKWDDGYSGLGYVINDPTDRAVLVVEDMFSAMAVCQSGYNAVSLQGTNLSTSRLEELSKQFSLVFLCLDADATRTAVRTLRAYLGGNPYCSLVARRLERDFKNMTDIDLSRWLVHNIDT